MLFIEALNEYYEREDFKGSNPGEFLKADPNLKMFYLGSSHNFATGLNVFIYLLVKDDGTYTIEWFRNSELVDENAIKDGEANPFIALVFKNEKVLIDYLNNMSFESLLNETNDWGI